MSELLRNKIDFTVVVAVDMANPNGDPSSGNEPRTSMDDYGEISSECIKRKIRNRLQDEGESIFVQSPERNGFDGKQSLQSRVQAIIDDLGLSKEEKGGKKGKKSIDDSAVKNAVLEKYLDVRSFGTVIAFKSNDTAGNGVSIGVRGPVTIRQTMSVCPVNVVEMGITKSVNGSDSEGKGSDTMGKRYYVEHGIYVINGSINPYLADSTYFTVEDANKIKEALKTLFVNDGSAARPEGSMTVLKLFWWEHEGTKIGYYPTATMHDAVKISPIGTDAPRTIRDYSFKLDRSFEEPGKKIKLETYGPLKFVGE